MLELPISWRNIVGYGTNFGRTSLAICGLILAVSGGTGIVLDLRAGKNTAIREAFCRIYACAENLILQAAYEQFWFGATEQRRAGTEAFRQALQRNAASPYRWCDLGDVMLNSGNLSAARYCFGRASALGPHLPQILWRAANFYFQAGDASLALTSASRVLQEAPAYNAVVFDSYRRSQVSEADVLRYGIPQDRRAVQDFVRYCMRTATPDQVQSAWAWARAHSFADDRLAIDYTEFLAKNRLFEAAAEAWSAYAGDRQRDYRKSNWVFNSGFEAEPSGAIFDWKLGHPEGTRAERDAGVAHSGRWSVCVRFDGRQNVAFDEVVQTIAVKPGLFSFEGYLKTQDITTDEGVGFRIVDLEAPARLDIRTDRLSGTHEWTLLGRRLVVPPQTRLLQVQVYRAQFFKFDNKISGTVWADDVRLAPAH